MVAECYRPGESFGTAFAKLLAHVFSDFGVILLDGSDPELDQIAAPLYRAAITRAPELAAALMKRDQQLRAAEYHQQVRITDSSTLLFVIRDGSRVIVKGVEAGDKIIVSGLQRVRQGAKVEPKFADLAKAGDKAKTDK